MPHDDDELTPEALEAPESPAETTPQEVPTEDVEAPEKPAEAPEDDAPEGDTLFPRSYVEKLRRESAEHRAKAKRVDELGERLHVALVTADGRLADPTDLPYDSAYLDDPEALKTAVSDLLARKPHLASRKPRGDIGQSVAPARQGEDFSLAGMLRARV